MTDINNDCNVAEFENTIELQAMLSSLDLDSDELGPLNPPHKGTLVRTPMPWRDSDPALVVGRDGAFFGYSKLHPSVLNNVLVLGGTGSGKSRSVVMPLLGAMLNYELENGKKAALLIIDPKRELEEKVRCTLADRGESDRLLVIGECPPIKLFTSDCPLSPSDRLEKLLAFGPADTPDGDHSYWKNLGLAMLRDLVQLEDEFETRTNGQRLIFCLTKELRIPLVNGKGFWPQLRDLLVYSCSSRKKLLETDQLLRKMCSLVGVTTSATKVMEAYTGDDELLRQWCYSVQSAQPLVAALANPDIARFVDLDISPGSSGQHTDVASQLETGQVILFCPESKDGHRVAGLALKQKYYESVYARQDQERGVFIIIDEAQRFLTNAAETGEQAFLDRCRGYRTVVVLASQSVASIKHALGSNAAAQTAVDILSMNCPTKVILRSTDIDTVAWLKTQLPMPADGAAHIIDIRRPACMAPGEGYLLLADGTWRRQRACLDGLS